MKKTIASFAAGLFVMALTAPVAARRCAGANAADTVQVAGTTLRLNGMGVREATVFNVDVYVASLYVVEPTADANAILGSDTPKQINLHFVRDVSRSDIVDAFEGGFRNNARGTEAAKIQQLSGWMTDMHVGQEMSLTYVPGRGTEVRVNGAVKGTIAGADFGRAVFSNFIGPRPPNAGLKRGLLGGRCG